MNKECKHCWHETTGVYQQVGSGTRICCHCGSTQHIVKVSAQIPYGHGKYFPTEMINEWIYD